jgi:multiple sugar transport system substrate-binding protein
VYNCTSDAGEIKILKEEIEKYSAEHKIRIKLIPFSGEEKLLSMMAAGQPPDIFYTNTFIRDRLASENRIIDLRQFADKDSITSQIREETIEQGKSIDGGWYHLCNWTNTLAVYFNKEVFDKNSVPYPKMEWTWDEMIETARKLTRDDNGDGKLDRYGIYIAPHFISALERMNHAGYTKNSLFAELPQESIETFNMYVDLFKTHQVMPPIEWVESMGMQYKQLLENGKIAMIVEAMPNPQLIEILKVRWDIVPLPKMNNKTPQYFRAYGGGLSISKDCKHPAEAWKFLKYLVFESKIYSPNPMLKNSDFTAKYLERYPVLKNSNFQAVWELSEKYDGGDYRDFVRYSSWSASVLLENCAPVLNNVLRGKESIDNLKAVIADVNKIVPKKVKDYLQNPAVKDEFRKKIESELNTKQSVH